MPFFGSYLCNQGKQIAAKLCCGHSNYTFIFILCTGKSLKYKSEAQIDICEIFTNYEPCRKKWSYVLAISNVFTRVIYE